MDNRYFLKVLFTFLISLLYISCNTSANNDETEEEPVVNITLYQRPDNYYNDDQDEILGEFEIFALDTLTLSSSNATVQRIIFNRDTLTSLSNFTISSDYPGTIIYFLEGVYSHEWFSSRMSPHDAACLPGPSDIPNIWLSFDGYCHAFILDEQIVDTTNFATLSFSGENLNEELYVYPELNKLIIENWYKIDISDIVAPNELLPLRIRLNLFKFDGEVFPIMLRKKASGFWFANTDGSLSGGWGPWDGGFYIGMELGDPNLFSELYISFVRY